METALAKLEAMFQKAEADLDWIQHRLEYEIRRNLPDDALPEEDPLAILEGLSAAKARYKALCARMDKISREQKEAMEDLQAPVENTLRIVLELQQKACLESSPLSAAEEAAAEQLGIEIGENPESAVEKSRCAGPTDSDSDKESRESGGSQSSRGWKGPLETVQSNPLSEQEQLQQIPQGSVPKNSKDGEFTTIYIV